VPLLFAVTLFVSASLLFMVQPMVAKLVLPLLGGSPAVWNACMVFFQALLLLGYLYADRLTRVKDVKKQWMIHLGVLTLPVLVFVLATLGSAGDKARPIPIVESLAPTETGSPVFSVLAILTVAIGVPFFVVSTSATLLQKWFTYTGHPSARDPYFLYAASNAGSLISLLGYPIFIEPNMTQGAQTWFWAGGFVALIGLIAFCGRAAANPLGVPPSGQKPQQKPGGKQGGANKQQGQPAQPGAPGAALGPASDPPPSLARKAKWTVLAFVPSSLMLGVTFHMTTDIASIPLLWVIPLALYLITFIIAFGRVPPWFRLLIGNLAPVMILLLVFAEASGNVGRLIPVDLNLLLHLLTFFAVTLMCHYELARDRPSPQYLTTFFLIMSLGGVLGGIFNALVAPIVFPRDYEYMLVLVIACLLVPRLVPDEGAEAQKSETRRRVALALDLIIPVLMGLAFWQLRHLADYQWFGKLLVRLQTKWLSIEMIYKLLIYAVPVMVCFFFVDRPLRFALCVAAIIGQTELRDKQRDEDVVYSERTFFGILKIERQTTQFKTLFRDEEGKPLKQANGDPIGQIEYYRLVHGTTLHGTQAKVLYNHPLDYFQMLTLDPWQALAVTGAIDKFNIREEPLTYYHRTGPVGAMFTELRTRHGGRDAKAHVAMVGLGTGSVSCYALPGQKLTFYEIDPAVKRLVADTDQYFTYVTDAKTRGAELDFRMGDARLRLKEDQHDPNRKYTLLLVDAFSSDAIPVHLLTVEAVQLYFNCITEDGMVALHISNKFISLEPVVISIANKLGLTARVWRDGGGLLGSDIELPGKTASSWVVLAREPEHLGPKLCSPLGDLVGDHGERTSLLKVVKAVYPDVQNAVKQSLNDEEDVLKWLDAKGASDPRAKQFAELIRKYGGVMPMMHVLRRETGYGFRPLYAMKGMDPWTDDHADVMRVMMLPQLQKVRKFFDLPTLADDE
jgi:hypothetical protein